MPFPPSNDNSSYYGNDRDNDCRNFSSGQLFTRTAVRGTGWGWVCDRTWGIRRRWAISGLRYAYSWGWISRTSSCRGRFAGLPSPRSGWNERKYRPSRFSTSQGDICSRVSKTFGSRIYDTCWGIRGATEVAIVSPIGDLSLEIVEDSPRQDGSVDTLTNLTIQSRA